jgi:hypothetical protein
MEKTSYDGRVIIGEAFRYTLTRSHPGVLH